MDIDINNIDIELLRRDLIDYFTALMFNISPAALVDLSKVEGATDIEVIQIAIDNKFDLEKYVIYRK